MSLNILIPLAGKNQFFPEEDYPFPKPLIEFCGKMMIEHVIDNLEQIQCEKRYIFIVNDADCKKFYLDNILNLMTNHSCKIIRLREETKGAACSAMMAIDYINSDEPLIISNVDQLFDVSLQEVINRFEAADAGVITFHSIHPRWSYVRTDKQSGCVAEASEKRPISKHAIAGFYYFKKGKDFIDSSAKMIEKDVNVDGKYYVALSLNEMVLSQKKVLMHEINALKYHTFYSPQKIKEYERIIKH